MTTFDDDFVRLNLDSGPAVVPMKPVGLEWPPPERLYLETGGILREAIKEDDPQFVLERVSMSIITDEMRAGMTHVMRGAEYKYVG